MNALVPTFGMLLQTPINNKDVIDFKLCANYPHDLVFDIGLYVVDLLAHLFWVTADIFIMLMQGSYRPSIWHTCLYIALILKVLNWILNNIVVSPL